MLFSAIGILGVALPLVLYLLFPTRAGSLLARLRAWLGRHEATILVALGLVLGVVFIQDALASL